MLSILLSHMCNEVDDRNCPVRLRDYIEEMGSVNAALNANR